MTSTVRKLVGVIVGLAVVIPLVVLMFISPASKGSPHEMPIGVVGQAQVAERIGGMLDARQPGAFEVRAYASSADLRAATADRDVYGGFAPGPRPETVIATGASPAVATMIIEIGDQIAAQSGATATVSDVAPAADGDPRGAGFGSMVMPVFMGGVALGAAAALVGRRRRIIAAVLPIGAALIAASAIGVAASIGVLSGTFWMEWLALAAGILAIAAPVAGLVGIVGPAGIGLAALLFMLVGMPLAGVSAPREFLPWIWGDIGQLLPLGATGTALRSAAFFDGAGSLAAYLVLGGWIVVGYLLLTARRDRAADDRAADDRAADDRATTGDPAVGDRMAVTG